MDALAVLGCFDWGLAWCSLEYHVPLQEKLLQKGLILNVGILRKE